MRCQEGRATCMFVYETMEQEKKDEARKLAQLVRELCWEIEKFPASEHQTVTAIRASTLRSAIVGAPGWIEGEPQMTIPENQPSETPVPTEAKIDFEKVGESISANAALLRLFKGHYRNSGDRHSDSLFVRDYISSLEDVAQARMAQQNERIAELEAKFDRCASQAGRAIIDRNEARAQRGANEESVRFLKQERDALRAQLAERDKEIERLRSALAFEQRSVTTWNGLCVEIALILGMHEGDVPFGDRLRERARFCYDQSRPNKQSQ